MSNNQQQQLPLSDEQHLLRMCFERSVEFSKAQHSIQQATQQIEGLRKELDTAHETTAKLRSQATNDRLTITQLQSALSKYERDEAIAVIEPEIIA